MARRPSSLPEVVIADVDPLRTPDFAADALGCSRPTIYRMMADKILEFEEVSYSGRRRKYRRIRQSVIDRHAGTRRRRSAS